MNKLIDFGIWFVCCLINWLSFNELSYQIFWSLLVGGLIVLGRILHKKDFYIILSSLDVPKYIQIALLLGFVFYSNVYPSFMEKIGFSLVVISFVIFGLGVVKRFSAQIEDENE